MVPWNSASGGFAYNWQSKCVGIIAIKTERKQIQFLSDVLVAVASPTACREICREKCGVVIMRKIAYIFQEITFSCCCLFIKETTWSLINDFQKKCSCDTTPDDKVYPFTKFSIKIKPLCRSYSNLREGGPNLPFLLPPLSPKKLNLQCAVKLIVLTVKGR